MIWRGHSWLRCIEKQKAHTCLWSNESNTLVSTLPGESRSLISSAKDRGVLSSPASPIASFRKALKTNSRHNAWFECKQVIYWTSLFPCDGYNEASSCLSSNCCLSSWFVSLRSCSRSLFYMINNSLKCTLLVRKHQASYELHLYEAGILLDHFPCVPQLQVFLSQTHVKISSNNRGQNLSRYLCGSANQSGISWDFYTNSHCRAMPTLYQPDQSHHPYTAARTEPLRFPADEKWGQNQQLCDGLK